MPSSESATGPYALPPTMILVTNPVKIPIASNHQGVSIQITKIGYPYPIAVLKHRMTLEREPKNRGGQERSAFPEFAPLLRPASDRISASEGSATSNSPSRPLKLTPGCQASLFRQRMQNQQTESVQLVAGSSNRMNRHCDEKSLPGAIPNYPDLRGSAARRPVAPPCRVWPTPCRQTRQKL
jgi:hypothetical protein